MSHPPAFCTIVAKNYLAYARVLLQSVRALHPEAAVYALLIDDPTGFFEPTREPFTVLTLDDVALPRPREFCFRYEVLELATAVKPYFLHHLLARGHDQVVFLDPDIRLYAPLSGVLAALRDADVVLTPHLIAPVEDEHKPGELDILLAGAYNLGFLGLARGPETTALLEWWQKRCERQALVDPRAGLFVDQRWMDLAPGFVSKLRVLRDPGYNVAYWNLAQRPLEGTSAEPRVQGGPLFFFHFSGLDPLRPGILSKHQDRFPSVTGEPLASLVQSYSAALLAAGHQTCLHWPYTHATFADGHPISRELRALFRKAPPGLYPEPFEPEGRGSFLDAMLTVDERGLAPLAYSLTPAWRASTRPREGPWAAARRRFRRLAQGVRAEASAQPLHTGLAPLALEILERRPDVHAASRLPDGALDRLRFLRWLATDGIAQHQLKPAWCLRWTHRAEVPGLSTRVIGLYDAQPELQRRFPLAFVAAHDAPRFLAALVEERTRYGLDDTSVAALIFLATDLPDVRIAEIWAARPDVQEAFPNALSWPGDPAFLAWLRDSGRQEYGITEDSVRWFDRARTQHICRRVQALYETRPDWQAQHPLAFSPLGTSAFVDWLARHPDAAPGFDVLPMLSLCAPATFRPLDELRQLHGRTDELRTRFPQAFREPGDTARLLEWVQTTAAPELRLPHAWMTALADDYRAAGFFGRGATVIGYLHTESGMGELARAMVRALQAVEHPVTTVTLEEAPQRQADLTVAGGAAPAGLPFTIVHVNAPEAIRLQRKFRDRSATSRLIGYWAWELSELPEEWSAAFALFDEVWTCSRFAAAAIGAAAPVPVQAMWPCVADLVPAPFDRARVGAAPGEFTFLFLYDLLSETERKNPLGLIRAFRAAFRGDDRVRLVIKTTNAEMRGEDFRGLVDAAQGGPVTVIDRYLSRPETLGLIAACDAYVSLHRSEGFGFTLAEAMWLGRPVIATHYSGNTDFMTPWNSFPVPFRLTALDRAHGPYRKGAVWAEPDTEAAASLLRLVFTDPALAAQTARRGQDEVRGLLSARACGERVAARLHTLSRHGMGAPRPVDGPPRPFFP